jgi:hypothetical protein
MNAKSFKKGEVVIEEGRLAMMHKSLSWEV